MKKPTDTELLNFLDNKESTLFLWAARLSLTGRGFRLHQFPIEHQSDFLKLGIQGFDTAREALTDAFLKERKIKRD